MKIDLKSLCELTILSFSPAMSPYSLIASDWLPSSRSELSLSRMEGLHKLAFSKTAHPPCSIIETSTESIHSNRLVPFLKVFIFDKIKSKLDPKCLLLLITTFSISLSLAESVAWQCKFDSSFSKVYVSSGQVLNCETVYISDEMSEDVYSKHPSN